MRTSTGFPRRPGIVLPLILVVIVLLTLGGYTYTESMLIELEATAAFARQTEARAAADSGAEVVAAMLLQPEHREAGALYHRPDLFRGITLGDDPRDPAFSVIVPMHEPASEFPIRYGLRNESGKLNLNRLLEQAELEQLRFGSSYGYADSLPSPEDFERTVEDRLLMLPGMNPELADAVLDWIDADDVPRRYGAERSYYESLPKPSAPKNGPLESLEELLLVRGVTRELLYGEDSNRNGLLDANEDDGDILPPADHCDGRLDRGWAAYLTVSSRESPKRHDGRDKIHLNQEALDSLYDEIEAEFGADAARFVAAYRLVGPLAEDEEPQGPSFNAGRFATAANSDVMRGGLDLSLGGNFEIFSTYELLGSRVEIAIQGQMTLLESPWHSGNLSESLPAMLEAFCTSPAPPPGRINLFEASRETLRTVTGLSESVIQAVLNKQHDIAEGEIFDQAAPLDFTPGWLLAEGLVDLPTMRRLDHYLTGGGAVFECQVLGTAGDRGPVTRLELLIDAGQQPPRFLRYADLTELGIGYPRRWLRPRD